MCPGFLWPPLRPENECFMCGRRMQYWGAGIGRHYVCPSCGVYSIEDMDGVRRARHVGFH